MAGGGVSVELQPSEEDREEIAGWITFCLGI